MAPMASLVLFDVDGTLVNVAGAGISALRVAFREVFGVNSLDPRASGVKFAGRTDLEIFESLARVFGVPLDRFRAEFGVLEARYLLALDVEMARREPSWRVLPGVQALLDRLAARPDACVGLLTGNVEGGARRKLEPFGLNRFFRTGGFGSDSRDRDVVARIAADRVAQAAGVDCTPDQVVVIGDTEHDIGCARANGFRAVAVATGWSVREALARARPDVLLDDLSDTATALSALGLPPEIPSCA